MLSWLRGVLQHAQSDSGESLVEVLLAVSLSAIAMATILGGLSGVTIAAQRHNDDVILESAISQAKQTLANAAFNGAATIGTTYAMPAVSGVTLTATVSALPFTGVQEVTIGAASATTSSARTTVVYKGNR